MRYLSFILILLLLQSCDQSSTITFSGTIDGAEDGSKVYFQNVNENNQPFDIDTLEIRDGKFSFEIDKQKQTQVGLLNFRNLNTTLIFFYKNDNIAANFDLNNLYESTFKGGKDNDLFNEFKNELLKFNKRKTELQNEMAEARQAMSNNDLVRLQTEAALISNEEQVFKKEFVDNNINSLLALMLLNEMIAKKEVTYNELEILLEKRDKNNVENVFSRLIEVNKQLLKGAEVGNQAPDFSGPTPDGDTLSLKDAMGKITLIDFWASWCRPCRVENPNVVRVHNQYKDKGFNIISVSLDRPNQRAQWLKAIEDDKMDWYHVSNLKYWDDPIAREYGVRSIPATFIIDENGKIVAKNLRGPALGQKVAELLTE
ncbi:TlpA disulfide reductase family protein [Planktosalinus lacus]|uniref:Thiol:disulfide interchange protein n=1 Tax=Planktosalinus lacus TaxID=1526573 RepID=A0A8J2VAA8_9FLAO|nr:TlpA disulfide reductase family protein [Planktosalinus lacus]GGD91176.1 thiol:disulfide interchange protein [Planktosalinus lacus]